MSDIISNGNSFNTVDQKIGLQNYKDALKYYHSNFDSALKLENNIPIFLDTNVLLRFYSISFKQRELLKKFFTTRKKQIILSNQVQKEFTKNREEVIEKYFETALGGLTQQFESDVINRLTKFREEHKEIIKDFNFLEKEMVNYKPKLDSILDELNKEIEKKRKQNKLIKFEDPALDLFTSFKQLDNVSKEEIGFLISEFDSLKKGIDPQKIKSEIKKPNTSFPGMGDIQEKPENPYGDYILFHEMIKYSKAVDKDIVFLTYDITKGDWLKQNKEPHIHYIQKVFQIANRSIFIVDANSFFENLFSTSFDSLIPNNSRVDDYSLESNILNQFFINFMDLERMIRVIAEYMDIYDDGRMSISKILQEFHALDIISKETYNDILLINQIKNDLLHKSNDYIRKRHGHTKLKFYSNLIEKHIDNFNSIYALI